MTTAYTPDKEKWGYLREHSQNASGTDSLTGLHRTGLDEYLAVIYPKVNDWIHDKAFGLFKNYTHLRFLQLRQECSGR